MVSECSLSRLVSLPLKLNFKIHPQQWSILTTSHKPLSCYWGFKHCQSHPYKNKKEDTRVRGSSVNKSLKWSNDKKKRILSEKENFPERTIE